MKKTMSECKEKIPCFIHLCATCTDAVEAWREDAMKARAQDAEEQRLWDEVAMRLAGSTLWGLREALDRADAFIAERRKRLEAKRDV